MNDREREIRRKLKDDFEHYAPRALKIRTKRGRVEPFALNKAQRHIHACLEEQKRQTGKVRAILLKGRQQGASTYTEGRLYWLVSHRKGVRAFILTHEAESTAALFEMAERYHEHCPPLVKPTTGASNARELYFSRLDSGYKVGTAGNKAVGRGTTVQYFHGSEVAFWPHASEHAKGVMQAIPDAADTEVILESTANGIGNYFHQQWQAAETGESEYIAIFVPWYWQDEYRKPVPDGFSQSAEEEKLAQLFGLDDEQLMFRRHKIAELSADGVDGVSAFKQEYPMTAQEAFQVSGGDTLIKPEPVVAARQYKCLGSGPLKIGVDPARFGDDRTAIIRRRNRAAYDVETYLGRSTMEVAGIVATIIKKERPAQVAIDVGGIGAGVVDRLEELGYGEIIEAVNFGSAAGDPELYRNKRAEMWWEMRNWLDDDMPVMIPDRNDLHADLCGPSYKYDSNQRRILESKEDMRKRGLRSPDAGDALALTFAEPVRKRVAMVEDTIADTTAGY
ncbi:hypothetical protein [Halomonas koreensis]|uniref:Terminase n=1 Tax=Halomonas koreensis TaxID=245385 RepID=A0ABU1G5Y6_9GAMM|nr:hypothetical protein [Halomonas koreensis]MDR5867933.1 hypothetical protein [Halomonas koreensis]